MKILRGFDDSSAYRGGFIAIGNFDGVHRGHQSMIAALVANARSAGVPAVVFTFDPHPMTVLRRMRSGVPPVAVSPVASAVVSTPMALTTLSRKLELLEKCGADCTIVYPTDEALLRLTPREFFDRIIVGELAARGLVEGPNFFFGHDRAGNVDTLREFCAAAGMELQVVPAIKVGDHLVSSSSVRGLIVAGRVAEAGDLLGTPYLIEGTVTRGAERGRTIGFPTANLEQIETVLPTDGVYAGRVKQSGRWFAAGINVGPNPTFGDQQRKVEVHLDGYSGDLYGQRLRVEFLQRLRDTIRFAGIEQLKVQLQQDVEAARTLANPFPSG